MRVTDLFLSLPQLPIFLLVVYLFRDPIKKVLGPELGAFVLIVAVIGALRWMPVARLVRAQFLSLREKEFVEAARALGVPTARQIVRHVLPNAIGPVIVAGSLDVAAAIILESTLSFLGLGFPPTSPPGGASSSTRRTISTSRRTGRSSRGRRSSSRCYRSTSSATACGTRWTRGGCSERPSAIGLTGAAGVGRRAAEANRARPRAVRDRLITVDPAHARDLAICGGRPQPRDFESRAWAAA